MVQIQSSWFPLYDRNPQTFVPSIFWAKPEDYQKADPADLPRSRAGELHRAAAGKAGVKEGQGPTLKNFEFLEPPKKHEFLLRGYIVLG